MLTALWWVADLLLIVAVFPIAMLLVLRIIRWLTAALRALDSISRSAQEITSGLPPALTEVSAAAQVAERLGRAKTAMATR